MGDDTDLGSRDDDILLQRPKQEEIIAPYFIDLALELSQFTSWCSQECHVINTITRTCKSIAGLQRNPLERVMTDSNTLSTSLTIITTEDILLQQAAVNNRRKTRPQPWQYGDDYRGRQNEVS